VAEASAASEAPLSRAGFATSIRARRALLAGAILFAAFSFAYGEGWPDVSRLALTQSFAYDGSVRIDRFARQTEDRADFGGHSYSDKAPGLSFVALPTLEAARAVGGDSVYLKVDSMLRGHIGAAIDAALAAGRITSDQAATLKARLAAATLPGYRYGLGGYGR
jgi:hypothetical protein